MTRKLGLWIDLSEQNNMKIFVSWLNKAEEDINNQEDLVANSVDTSHLISPAIPSLPNGLMNKVAMVAEIEVIMHGLNNMDFHSQRLSWLRPLPSV